MPPWAQDIVQVNPLVPIIEMARGLVLHGELPPAPQVALVALAGAVCVQLGHAVFTMLHRRFADVL